MAGAALEKLNFQRISVSLSLLFILLLQRQKLGTTQPSSACCREIGLPVPKRIGQIWGKDFDIIAFYFFLKNGFKGEKTHGLKVIDAEELFYIPALATPP